MPRPYAKEIEELFASPITDDEASLLPVDMSYPGPKSKKQSKAEIQQDFVHQVGADWNRNAGLTYYIAGVSALALNEYQVLDSAEKVADLFKRTLLLEMDESNKNDFFRLLIPHLHQGGLIHNAATRLRECYCKDEPGVAGHQKLFFHGDTFFYALPDGIGIIECNRLTRVLTTKEDKIDIEQMYVGSKTDSPVEITTLTSIRFTPPDGISFAPITTHLKITDPSLKPLLRMRPTEANLFAAGREVLSELLYDSSKAAMSLGLGVGNWLGIFNEPTPKEKALIEDKKESIKMVLSKLQKDLRQSIEEGFKLYDKAEETVIGVKAEFEEAVKVQAMIPATLAHALKQIEACHECQDKITAKLASLEKRQANWQHAKSEILKNSMQFKAEVDDKVAVLKTQLQSLQTAYHQLRPEEQENINDAYLAVMKDIEKKQLSLLAYKQAIDEKTKSIPSDNDTERHIMLFQEQISEKVRMASDDLKALSEHTDWLKHINRESVFMKSLGLNMGFNECALLLAQTRARLTQIDGRVQTLVMQLDALMSQVESLSQLEEIDKVSIQIEQMRSESQRLTKQITRIHEHIIRLNEDITDMRQELGECQRKHCELEQDKPKLKKGIPEVEGMLSIHKENTELEKKLSLPTIKRTETAVTPSPMLETLKRMKASQNSADKGHDASI